MYSNRAGADCPEALRCPSCWIVSASPQHKESKLATRSLIARHNRDGSFDSITVTFGDPEWIGPLLLRHYMDEAKVEALIVFG
jgi:hypothetical protein